MALPFLNTDEAIKIFEEVRKFHDSQNSFSYKLAEIRKLMERACKKVYTGFSEANIVDNRVEKVILAHYMKYILTFFILLFYHSLFSQKNPNVIVDRIAVKEETPKNEYNYTEEKAIKSFEIANPINALAFSPDGNYMMAISNNVITEIDISNGTRKNGFNLKGHTAIKLIKFSHDGKYLFSIGETDNMLKIWDIRNSKEIRTIKIYDERIDAIAFSYDNKYFLIVGYKILKINNLLTGENIQSFKYEESEFVRSVAISSDGNYIAAGMSNNVIKLWNIKTGKVLHTIKSHKSNLLSNSPNDMGEVVSIAFSPDSKYLLTGGNIQPNTNAKFANTDKVKNHIYSTLKLWDIQLGKEKQNFIGGDYSSLDFACFSPDGRYIFTSGDKEFNNSPLQKTEKVIKVWDTNSSKLISILSGSAKLLAFSFDNKYIISSEGEKEIKLWDISFLHINNSQINIENNMRDDDIEIISSTNITKYEILKTQNTIKQYTDMLSLLGESPNVFQAGKDIEALFEHRNNYVFNDLELNGGNIEIYAYILKIVMANEKGEGYRFGFNNSKLQIDRYKEKYTSVVLNKTIKSNQLNTAIKIKIIVNPETGKIINILKN